MHRWHPRAPPPAMFAISGVTQAWLVANRTFAKVSLHTMFVLGFTQLAFQFNCFLFLRLCNDFLLYTVLDSEVIRFWRSFLSEILWWRTQGPFWFLLFEPTCGFLFSLEIALFKNHSSWCNVLWRSLQNFTFVMVIYHMETCLHRKHEKQVFTDDYRYT